MSEKKPKREHSKQFFNSVDEIYKARQGAFIKLARRHVYNPDLAIDMVHDALAKSLEYFNKNKERKVREEVINWLILKACNKANKYSREIAYGDLRALAKLQCQDYSESN